MEVCAWQLLPTVLKSPKANSYLPLHTPQPVSLSVQWKRIVGVSDARKCLCFLMSLLSKRVLHKTPPPLPSPGRASLSNTHQTFNLDTQPCPLTWLTLSHPSLGHCHPTPCVDRLLPNLSPVCPGIPPLTWMSPHSYQLLLSRGLMAIY